MCYVFSHYISMTILSMHAIRTSTYSTCTENLKKEKSLQHADQHRKLPQLHTVAVHVYMYIINTTQYILVYINLIIPL